MIKAVYDAGGESCTRVDRGRCGSLLTAPYGPGHPVGWDDAQGHRRGEL